MVSPDSNVAEFIAAALPAVITFSGSYFDTSKTSIKVIWDLPTITASDLDINYYNIYWDEGYLGENSFVLLGKSYSED